MTRTPEQHSADSKVAALTMWANVPDPSERLRNAHANSPSGLVWHARRLFGPDVDMDDLSPKQVKAVESARLAWLKANALKGVRAKQRRARSGCARRPTPWRPRRLRRDPPK